MRATHTGDHPVRPPSSRPTAPPDARRPPPRRDAPQRRRGARRAAVTLALLASLVLGGCEGQGSTGGAPGPGAPEAAATAGGAHGGHDHAPAGHAGGGAAADERGGRDGATPPAPPALDWCAGHALPESKCTKCNPELAAGFKEAGDWCDEHGFPESACPVCNPQAPPNGPSASGAGAAPAAGAAEGAGAPVAADWCREHHVPESKCTRCNPGLVAGFQAAGDWCETHGYPESVCPVCNPMTPPDADQIYTGLEVRLRSEAVERAAGLQVTPARDAALASSVRAVARLAWDERRVAEVGAPVAGVVREALAVPGEAVEAGAPLFVITSAQVGELRARIAGAKDRVTAARAELARQKELLAGQVAAARDVAEARRELAAAQAEQRSLEAAMAVAGDTTTTGDVTVTAPMAGVVLERAVARGAVVEAGATLATLVDPSSLWALVDVPEGEAGSVAVGQAVHITVAGVLHEATIEQLSPSVDPRTRTVRARATLANPGGRLRAGQLARARIHVATAERAVAVPRAAIQRVEDATLVFVRTAPLVYEPRVVKAVRRAEDLVQVTGRLRPGDEVVTVGAWLLRTEVVPGSIGAGCCGD